MNNTDRISLNEDWDLVRSPTQADIVYYLTRNGVFGNSEDHLQDTLYFKAIKIAVARNFVYVGSEHYLTELGKAMFKLCN